MRTGEIQLEHKKKIEHKFNKQNFFESFLNLMISSLFTSLYLLVVACFSSSAESDFMGNTYYFCILSFFFSGLVFQVLLDLFSETNKRIGLHLRILFFWIAIIVAVCYFLQQIYAPYYLIPGMILEYIFTVLLNKPIYFQEKFLKQIEPWDIKTLGPNLRADSITVETLNKAIDRNRLILLISCIIIITASFIVNRLKEKITSPTLIVLMIIFTILYFVCSAFLFAVYNVFQKNTYFAFLGFKNVISKKRIILKYSLIIISISLLFGAILSRNKTIFSLYFEPAPYNQQYREPQQVEKQNFEIEEDDVKIDLKDMMGQDNSNPILDKIMDFLSLILIITFAIFILFLFFRYIITDQFLSFFREHMLLNIIKEIFLKIKLFFESLFGLKKTEKETYATVNSRNFKNHIDRFIKKAKKSSEKKQELDRLTKKFMQIISWGDKNKIKYRNTMAPAEYINQINNSLSDIDILRVGYIYEKSLYSNELLSEQEEKEYFDLANKVLSM